MGLLVGALPCRAALIRIPAFARQYHTTCSTCHTAAPKLNVLGEAFRLNGYRFPQNTALIKREPGVPLGDDAWKDLWPRAIWPGEIPAVAPIAIRIASDALAQRGGDRPSGWSLRFPGEVYLLAAAPLGDGLSVFLESEWSKSEGFEVVQAKVEFQDPFRWLPRRALNLWVGQQNPYLFTFADRQIDQAGRLSFIWQEFNLAGLHLSDPARNRDLQSASEFAVSSALPAVELNGLVGGRAYYGLGIAQSVSGESDDGDHNTAVYYKLRYKWGGLRLDGQYDKGGGALPKGYGQLLDRAIILEHFGYIGSERATDGARDSHQTFGANLRVLDGRLDAGLGAVQRRDDDPWSTGASSVMTSVFGKVEYFMYPWLAGSLKVERFRAGSRAAERAGFTLGSDERTRIAPGVIALVRQNVRLVLEGELYTSHRASAQAALRRPTALWLRLDLSF